MTGTQSDVNIATAISGEYYSVTITGGSVAAKGYAVQSDSAITVTGGSICGDLSDFKGNGCTVAYLVGTSLGGAPRVTGNSLVVEVDSLEIPRSRGGGSDGLTVIAGNGTATWDTTRDTPRIAFDVPLKSIIPWEWGSYVETGAPPSPPGSQQGSSFQTAIPITLNTPVTVSITDGDRQYYAFTPTVSGIYIFTSSNMGSMDPYADLYDSAERQVTPVDNGAGYSFRLTYALTGGQKYYFVPSAWGYATGSYTLTVTTKTAAVGAQSGRLTPGVAGTVTFPVTTTGIANGTYTVSVANLPTGVTVQGQVMINNNSGTLTLAGSTMTTAGVTNTLRLTIDGAQSEPFSLVVSAVATTTTPMSNFVKVNTYSRGQFQDVNEAMWYGFDQQKVIAGAFEYGLMRGNSATAFNPLGNITVAEALAIAARVHSIYATGSENFVQGNPWYDVYIEYSVMNGIIMSSDFTEVNRPATRAEMAYIFSRALPQSEFPSLNTVNSLPDVTSATRYSDAIFMLYRAGVLTGSDAVGTFYPLNPITRAEAAAIITRVILPDNRWSGRNYG